MTSAKWQQTFTSRANTEHRSQSAARPQQQHCTANETGMPREHNTSSGQQKEPYSAVTSERKPAQAQELNKTDDQAKPAYLMLFAKGLQPGGI